MHGRFHGQDGNAVREKQSRKPTGHQPILVKNPDFLSSKISDDGFLIQRFFNPVSLASALVLAQPCRFTRLPHRLVQMMRTGSVEARYCREMKKQRIGARNERRVGQPTVAWPKCRSCVAAGAAGRALPALRAAGGS